MAQIKDAARAATAAGTAGPVITGLIDAALRASKRARTQTTISTEGISLARAGLDLAGAHLGGLAARRVVVVGTGSTGKLAARLLREAGVGRLWVASRSQQRAAEVAAAVHGRPLRTGDVPAVLADADLLVTATGAAAPVVLAEHVCAARAQAGGRPLFVLDLGMPPDVDPAVGRLAGVTLIDVAALGRHLAGRAAAIAERGFLAALDAGCTAPVGALAELTAEATGEPELRLSGVIAAPDGSSVIRAEMTGAVSDGDTLGRRLAQTLLEHGGAALLHHSPSALLIATKNGGN